MHISTVWVILKELKANGTIKTLPGRGPMFILPPCTARQKNLQGWSLQNYYVMLPPCQQMTWKTCQKKRKKKNAFTVNNLYVSMVEVAVTCCCGGGKFVRVHGIMNSMKYQIIVNLNLAGSLLDLPARQWSKKHIQINTKMVNWKQNQASAIAIPLPWLKTVG